MRLRLDQREEDMLKAILAGDFKKADAAHAAGGRLRDIAQEVFRVYRHAEKEFQAFKKYLGHAEKWAEPPKTPPSPKI